MKKKNNYFAVIGRIPFDDEDACYCYKASSRRKAVQKFEDDMYADVDDAEDLKERHIKNHGAAVYITHVLKSNTEIKLG